jgi:mycothiol synthase
MRPGRQGRIGSVGGRRSAHPRIDAAVYGAGMPTMTGATGGLTMRPLAGDDDYWRLRELLRRAMVANGHRQRSWHVARLDYWWWFVNPDITHLDPTEQVLLWEDDAGEIVAAVNPEGSGEAHLQVDPSVASPELDEALIEVAEARLAIVRDGQRRLQIFVDAADTDRQAILARRGFRRLEQPGVGEWQHRRDLGEPLPDVPVIPGYAVRPMADGLELLERCYASGLAFHGDDIAVARRNRDDPAWYHHIQAAPTYRRDLDIVAVARDGAIAAFCCAWFDDVSRTAYLEPVATVPAHRRHGLARACILEALHRVQGMGCLVAFVGGYSNEANALYGSVMGPDHDISEPWEKIG